jgi:hypothetical protein
MAKILSKAGIASLNIVRPGQVSQSVDAFTGIEEYDIYLSGSFNTTGSITCTGNISSSGDIYANRFEAAGYVSTPLLTNINPIAANQLISSSQNIHARSFSVPSSGIYHFNNSGSNTFLQGGVSSITMTVGGAQKLSIGSDLYFNNFDIVQVTAAPLFVQGNITSSVNISASGYISASSFIGDGSSLTNLQRPITSSTTHFTASNNNTGFYFRGDGSVTCSIQQNSVVTCDIGNEFEIFQTSSAGYILFATGSGVTLNSKSNNQKLAGQFSAATLKKVGTNEWDLIGDLG